MQLNITTDYAIRFLLCMGDTGAPVTGSTVAEQAKIPPKYLLKIARKLREAGLLGTVTGAKGGYYPRKDLAQITLSEVLMIMEPTIKLNRCLEPDACCTGGAGAFCRMRRYYQRIQEDLEEKWFSRSLEEIVDMMDSEESERGGSRTGTDSVLQEEETSSPARCVIYISDDFVEKEGKKR